MKNARKHWAAVAEKELAKKHGIPKHMRQYCRRYGQGVEMLIATQRKFG